MTDLIEAELVDLGAWTAASNARRAEIVQRTLSALPEFELVGLKDYQIDGVPSDRPIPIATFCHKDSGILFNLVPGGTFIMGFSDRQANALLTEAKAPEAELGPDDHFFVNSMLADPSGMRPAHSVTIQPFLLARRPLRTSEAAAFLGIDSGDPNAPRLDDTGYTDVAAFPEEDIRQFLGLMPFRLPSESEWEYACRADSDTLFWWGDQIPTDARWAEDLDDPGEMDKYSNRFGLANFGAYPECCADQPHESYDGAPADGSSWRDDPDSQNFVIRGGAMLSYPWQGCGEWLQMLSADRFPAESDLGVTIRPAFTLGTI